MTLNRNTQEGIIYLIRLVLVIFLPLLCGIILLPIYIYPEIFEHFKYNFIAHIFTREYCEFRPQDCKKHVGNQEVNSPLRITKFPDYDVIYIRHYIIEQLENKILVVFSSTTIRDSLLFLRSKLASNSTKFDNMNDKILWLKFLGRLHVTLASFICMVYNTIRGVIFLYLWIFLTFGVAMTLTLAWNPVFLQIKNLTEMANDFF